MSACKHLLPRRFDSSAETQDTFSQQPATSASDTQPDQSDTVQAPPKQAKLRVRRISKDEAKRRMGPQWKEISSSSVQVQKTPIGKEPVYGKTLYEYRFPMPDGSFRKIREYYKKSNSDEEEVGYGDEMLKVDGVSVYRTKKGDIYEVSLTEYYFVTRDNVGRSSKFLYFYSGGPEDGVSLGGYQPAVYVFPEGIIISISYGEGLSVVNIGTSQKLVAEGWGYGSLGEHTLYVTAGASNAFLRSHVIYKVLDNPNACIIYFEETEEVNRPGSILPELYLLVEWG